MEKRVHRNWGLIVCATALFAVMDAAPAAQLFAAAPWPEADALFRTDPKWAGADDAYSIDLGGERTLWLFADTFIDPSARQTRPGSKIIPNSIGVQQGHDPSRAAISFHWRNGEDGQPAPFFPSDGEDLFWPGHGIRIEDTAVVFLMRVRRVNTGLGFDVTDWDAAALRNLDAAPDAWRLEMLDSPRNDIGVIVGSAGVCRVGEHVYAFGSKETQPKHAMYLVRWNTEDLRGGALDRMAWWSGGEAGWISGEAGPARAVPAFTRGQSELTAHFDAPSKQFLVVQTVGFGPAFLAIRTAPALEGPWSDPVEVYRPPEYTRADIMIYAGKAHPQLTGSDLVLTYATNNFKFAELVNDSALYYPRFVRLTRRGVGN